MWEFDTMKDEKHECRVARVPVDVLNVKRSRGPAPLVRVGCYLITLVLESVLLTSLADGLQRRYGLETRLEAMIDWAMGAGMAGLVIVEVMRRLYSTVEAQKIRTS